MDIKMILLALAIIMYLGCGLGNCMFLGSLGYTLKLKIVLHTIFVVPAKSFFESINVLPEVSHKISYTYLMKNLNDNIE